MVIQFVVKYQNDYLLIRNGCVIWTRLEDANKYASKYAAKKHIRTMEIPDNIKIEGIEQNGETEEGNEAG